MTDVLTDTEKFSIMARVYAPIYDGYENFSEKVTASRSTIHNWEQRKTETINGKSKSEICDIFSLQYTIWTDKFYDNVNFENSLQDYHKIKETINEDEESMIHKKMVGTVKNITEEEESLLHEFSQHKIIDIVSLKFTNMTPMFLYEFAELLKNKKQIKDAIFVLEFIEGYRETYRYTHHNKIQHLKAILLSDNKLKKWDEAIHVLSLLYSGSHYHLNEPEIMTLMASNFKRKALTNDSGWIAKEYIDKDLLFRAFSLYHDAYRIKDPSCRYYDAINIAYLNNIIDTIEPEYTDKLAIQKLYNQLIQKWTVDPSNWWEVSSKAEFLMLIDQPKLAISEVSFFLESQKVKPFDIESTLRQLEMYLHFVDDENAQVFYDFLVQSWECINTNV